MREKEVFDMIRHRRWRIRVGWGWLVLVFVVGVQVGIFRGRELERTKVRAAGEIMEVSGGPRLTTPADPLRCTNGDPPQRWTRVDAEAMIHAAQQAYATAGHYGGSMAHKLAWATEGLLALELVKACAR